MGVGIIIVRDHWLHIFVKIKIVLFVNWWGIHVKSKTCRPQIRFQIYGGGQRYFLSQQFWDNSNIMITVRLEFIQYQKLYVMWIIIPTLCSITNRIEHTILTESNMFSLAARTFTIIYRIKTRAVKCKITINI